MNRDCLQDLGLYHLNTAFISPYLISTFFLLSYHSIYVFTFCFGVELYPLPAINPKHSLVTKWVRLTIDSVLFKTYKILSMIIIFYKLFSTVLLPLLKIFIKITHYKMCINHLLIYFSLYHQINHRMVYNHYLNH